MKTPEKLVLIDGHALVHRAFHALPPLANPSGVPTNAIFGFCSVLIKMIKDLKPKYVAASFDLAGPTFRHEEFAEYKSHRVKAPDELHIQVPYIKEILTAFGIPIYEKAGFEADDVIGAVAELAKETDDLQTVIMTGDLDTLQLVEDDKVVVFTLRKGVTDTVTYNEAEVKKRYGLAPSQMTDFKGLKGDPSDNIPGVPGIGDVTASALIKQFKSLEGLYEAIDKKKKLKILTPKLVEKLSVNKDQAFFSKKLATIIRDVDVDFALADSEWRAHMDREKLEKLLKDLALFSIVKRITELDAPEIPVPVQGNLLDSAPTAPAVHGDLLSSPKDILDCLGRTSKQKEFVLDYLNGVLMVATNTKDVLGFPETSLSDKKVLTALKDLLEDPNVGIVAHDSKPLCRWALKQGIKPVGFSFDLKLAAFVINSDTRDYTLERLYFMEFGRDMSPEPLARPAAICELKEQFQKRLSLGRLRKVFDDIELPLVPVLARMENKGILVDPDVASALKKLIDKEIVTLEKDIHKHAGKEFNINSPAQLSDVLFNGIGLKGRVKKTAKGAISTAAGELEKLVDEHPVIALILKYRELQKLKTTYVEPLPLLIDPKTHRIHTTYNQAGAATGRLSSQDPNLQNIPIRTELGQEFRKVFVADKGMKLVSCDYSQVELRIAAHISGDEAMSDAFKKGEDIHTRTAAQAFHVKPEQVTKEMRRQAKVLNFGVLYGMGILGFQRAAGVSREEARLFIEQYKKGFPKLMEWIERTKSEARRTGYVETVFGRRRAVPDINSSMPAIQAGAERIAFNHPIQGTAADLLKLAMVHLQKFIDENCPDDAAMLLNVHDELLFEIKADKVGRITPQLVKIMESITPPSGQFNVPIVADAKVGDNWAEMSSLPASGSEQ